MQIALCLKIYGGKCIFLMRGTKEKTEEENKGYVVSFNVIGSGGEGDICCWSWQGGVYMLLVEAGRGLYVVG
jgi:hypothetical protein